MLPSLPYEPRPYRPYPCVPQAAALTITTQDTNTTITTAQEISALLLQPPHPDCPSALTACHSRPGRACPPLH
jgi:hypothetical protein